MERLTRKSDTSDMVWFIDREHKSGYAEREPCEMDAHHARLAIAKLAEYEDLEEQGKLLKLPVAVGGVVYVIPSKANYKLNIINGYSENNRVYEQIVNRIEISDTGYLLVTCDGMASVVDVFYKKSWFLTREEAEAALEELERGKGE